MTIAVRTAFISDVHLGTRACQAGPLLAFLRRFEFERLYLVGDIIDLWSLQKSFYWPAEHNTVVQKILRLARRGVGVTYVVGNHDEALREHLEMTFGDIRLEDRCVHRAADGREYLVVHGDRYDQVMRCPGWLSALGDLSYEGLIALNRVLSWGRRRLGIAGRWSLAGYAKRNLQSALEYVRDFEQAVAHDAARQGFRGVICGHIHTPVIRQVGDVTYVNCGDWVDSCSAIVEHADGRLELLHIHEEEELRLAA